MFSRYETSSFPPIRPSRPLPVYSPTDDFFRIAESYRTSLMQLQVNRDSLEEKVKNLEIRIQELKKLCDEQKNTNWMEYKMSLKKLKESEAVLQERRREYQNTKNRAARKFRIYNKRLLFSLRGFGPVSNISNRAEFNRDD